VRHCYRADVAAALVVSASLVTATPAPAQAPAIATGPNGMSLQEWQSLSCIWGGALGSGLAFFYNDIIVEAVTGAVLASDLLLVPVMATGFLAGCSVGSSAAPGLVWLYRHL
jgi:hypothetical protein